jgi:spore coat protein CotF
LTTQIAMPSSGQLPKVKGPEMNDRDLVNDMLSFEKYLSAGYNVGLNEAQNPALHQQIQLILNDTHQCQFEMFNLMFEHGWYKMKAADQQEVGQAYTQFSNYRTQFPSFQ